MKTLLGLAVALALALSAKAGELFFPNPSSTTIVFTNITFSSNVTAAVTYTNKQNSAMSRYHTFQFFCTQTGQGTNTVYLDRTIDGSNWIPVVTNTFTASGVYELNNEGKWAQYQWRVTSGATNATLVATYMSQ